MTTAVIERPYYMEVPQKKLKVDLSCHPAIPLQGTGPNRIKLLCQKDICGLGMVAHVYNPCYQGDGIGGSGLKSSPGKRLERPHLKKQAES
jgi:hypothetical protein